MAAKRGDDPGQQVVERRSGEEARRKEMTQDSKWWSAGAAKKQVGQSLWQVSDERWQVRSRWSRAGCEEAGGAEPVARISCDGARSG